MVHQLPGRHEGGAGHTQRGTELPDEPLLSGPRSPDRYVLVPDPLIATFGPQSTVAYDERFELVRTVPLLILDDLGTESATPWAREKLYQLINHRYNYRLATVITTNLKPEAIEPRIYSRLCDPACGTMVMVVAPDFRRRAVRNDK